MKIVSTDKVLAENLLYLDEQFNLFRNVKEIEIKDGEPSAKLKDGCLTVFCLNRKDAYPLIGKALCFGSASKKRTLFERTGIMLDCARNGVPKTEAVKRFVPIMAVLGYDYLELYTEDCMEVKGEPQFGYARGKYALNEIRELDKYCEGYGIELTPCIQTLAHLSRIFMHYKEYASVVRDKNDVLLVGEERTYELIENIVKSCSEAFSSRIINIGMDEAFDLGAGRYFDKHGYESKSDIMRKHLKRVVEICKKYGFSPSLWGDMFYRDKNEINGEDVPKNVSLIYWNYLSDKEDDYKKVLGMLDSSGVNYSFAGAVHKWYGFAPLNEYSEYILSTQFKVLQEFAVKEFRLTAWGDGGAECSFFSVLPSIAFTAEKNYGLNGFCDKILKTLTGYNHEEFLTLDAPNKLYDGESKRRTNPSKYLLYADPFVGMEEFSGQDDYVLRYKEMQKKLERLSRRKSPFSYLFKTLERLCSVLKDKCVLTETIRKAYDKKDTERLNTIATENIPRIIRALKSFIRQYFKQWNYENKPQGLEVQQYRLFGLMGRLECVRKKITDYVSGVITTIEELDDKPVYCLTSPYGYNGCTLYNGFVETVTYNTF